MIAHDSAQPSSGVLPNTQQYRFFGGKGGVGKTTCSTAAAIRIAEAGHRVLIVSTDPAHSLGDALAMRLSSKPTRVPLSRSSLYAVELNADQALERWIQQRKRNLQAIAEHGTYLDAADIKQLLNLSLPGVDELVGLVELRRLALSGDYDQIIVDTAPTGHTLRLLTMPDTLRRIASIFDDMQAKHRFLSESLGGVYRPDAGDELIEEIDSEGRELMELLCDPNRCTFSWVLLPEMMSLEEAKDGIAALQKAGIAVHEVIVNRVKLPPQGRCTPCEQRIRAEAEAITAIRASFAAHTIVFVPEQEGEPRGVPAFRKAKRQLEPKADWKSVALHKSKRSLAAKTSKAHRKSGNTAWLNQIASPGCVLLLFAGKGGVGKTTCAATAALAIADRNPKRKILLLSTDPAHSVGDVLQMPIGDAERPLPGVPSLRARQLDAEELFRRKRESYLESVNDLFDALQGDSRFDVVYDRAVARNLIDLSPPGLDEIFGVLSVSDAVLARDGRRAKYDMVVLDTAPTGHALRLLQMPTMALDWVHALLSILLKYQKVTGLGQLASDLLQIAHELRELLELLHDPKRTQLVAVTRAAQLPRIETVLLLKRVRQMKIAVSAVLVNAVTIPGCPRCRRAAARERREIGALSTALPKILAPALAVPPQGVEELRRFGESWKQVRS